MNHTRHSITRARQRGMNQQELDLIYFAGFFESAPGGARRIRLGRKDVKKLRNSLDRIANGAVLVEGKDGVIITAYKLH